MSSFSGFNIMADHFINKHSDIVRVLGFFVLSLLVTCVMCYSPAYVFITWFVLIVTVIISQI